jgi:UDP-N-acetylglucosamine acyltransferase
MNIHPTAIIEQNTNIDPSVTIDAYSIVRQGSVIGKNTKIDSCVEIAPNTKIGNNNHIFKGAYIGATPQDKSFNESNINNITVNIGDYNIIREYVTIHHSTADKPTTIGSHNYLMAYSHVAHDCILNNHITLANYVGLAGWVQVEDYVFISGHTLVHQFVRVGEYSMIGGLCRINQDVPPYALIAQENGKLYGLNTTGLRRAGWSSEKILQLKRLYKILFKKRLSIKTGVNNVVSMIESSNKNDICLVEKEAVKLTNFIHNAKRGVISK